VGWSTVSRRLCLVSPIRGIAGPAAFQRRLAEGLAARGHEVSYDLNDRPYDAVLVSGGTRRLAALRRAQAAGIPILQRLDGINWIHRRRRTGWRHFLRAELNNLLLRATRRLASRVVYQSAFVRSWWERSYGAASAPAVVIHNGVPLDIFSPRGPAADRADGVRLLVLEARLGGGYEIGLEWAVELGRRLKASASRRVELAVAGEVSTDIDKRFTGDYVSWLGAVPAESVPRLIRSADLLYASDVNPACPNSVIEAMACGVPVLAFDTGAVREVVGADAGRVVAYGGDPWRLDPPDIAGLEQAAGEILARPADFRRAARARAEAGFGVDRMVEAYLAALGWTT
jgi:glycosyltransferase involved in cell wall biosynthesis